MSIEDPSVIPLAVISAISLFVLREFIEAIRRQSTNRRRLKAIKALLAAECERNNFAIQRLDWAINNVARGFLCSYRLSIENPYTTREFLWVHDDDGVVSGTPVPKIYVTVLDKYLFEAAGLEKKLFDLMRDAQDALSDLQHVRDSLVTYVNDRQEELPAFARWAKAEVEERVEPVRSLYFSIENEPLTKIRIR